MSEAAAADRRIGYARARLLLLGVGLAVLLVIAVIMLVRSVQTVEVIGVLLFIPIFVAFVFWRLPGGVIAGAAAAGAYIALRYPAIQTLGWDPLSGLLATRTVAYLLFGILGGWANRQLEASLTKLELYDQIDDATGLFNARFFLQDSDLEMSRSRRYQTIFSVAVVDLAASSLEPLSRRQRTGILRELGRRLKDSIRTVDRAVHGHDGKRHRLLLVLPETGKEGAQVFVDRLAGQLETYLQGRGVSVEGNLQARPITYPEDEEELVQLRGEFAEIDRAEHPEETQSTVSQ